MDATFFASPSELRNWLEENHSRVEELWFGFYKKASGKTGITYQEALDEALCFGWIDGVRKSLDEGRYKIRFTPRKPGSIWSLVNIARVQELIRQGRRAPPGLQAFAAPSPELRYNGFAMKSSTPPPRLARLMANLGLSFLGAEIVFGLIVLLSVKAGLVPGPQGEAAAAWFFLSILYVPALVLGVFLCCVGARRVFPRTVPFTSGAATVLGCGVGACLAVLALFTDIL